MKTNDKMEILSSNFNKAGVQVTDIIYIKARITGISSFDESVFYDIINDNEEIIRTGYVEKPFSCLVDINPVHDTTYYVDGCKAKVFIVNGIKHAITLDGYYIEINDNTVILPILNDDTESSNEESI